MIILHIITNLNAGGAETSLFQLVTHNEIDTQIVVSMQDLGVYGPELQSSGIEVHQLNMTRGRVSFSGLRQLYRIIRQHKPDAIQTWMYHADLIGGLAARLAGIKNVCWGIHHSNLDISANSRTLLAIVRLCGVLSRTVPSKIVSCSQKSTTVHIDRGFSREKFRTIPNGYDLQKFKFDAVAREHYRTKWDMNSGLLLGTVGRWHPQKDHENLISAISLLNQRLSNPVRCVLIGKGMSSDNLALVSMIQQYNASEYFVLAGLSDDVPGVMSALDIHILSSRGEAFPNVVAEAMACNTPCVVTDVGDAKAIVGSTGWSCAAENAEALSKSIELAIIACKSKEQWPKRREACRRRIIENYDIANIVERYRDVWQG